METTAMILAKHLKEEGIDYAFGIPGGEVLEIIEAFRKTGIQFILTKHEMGAGIMADAYYQLTGKPGVLVSTLGPGLTNTVTPVANAYLDRNAMIVITGEVSTRLKGVYTHQILEQRDILKPVTKWSATLSSGSASQTIQKAIDIAKSGYPGPVHINVPTDVAVAKQIFIPRREKEVFTAEPSPETVDAFIGCIRRSERPVLLAGLGIGKDEALPIRQFCEKWNIPVLTTYKAKGIVPEDASISLGGTGLSPVADKQHLALLQDEADLIITVGFDPVELRSDWNLSWSTKTINIDIVPNAYQLIPVDLEYVGNIRRFFEKLMEIANVSCKWPDARLLEYKNELGRKMEPKERAGLSPYDVVNVSRKLLPRNCIAVVDTGSHRIMLNHVWESYGPKELLQSNGLGTMGYALPAAIAARLVHPDRTIVAFTGDAGLDMVLGEMALLNQYKLPITVVVFRDNLLSLIRVKQERLGYESSGVEFAVPDYVLLAQSFGGKGLIVRTVEDLRSAIKSSANSDTFTLIEARINPKEYWQQM